MADSQHVSTALKSGLTGGAATGRGVNYQSQYATYVALKLIAKLLRETPTERPVLVIEPRIVSDTDRGLDLTRWDIQVSGKEYLAVEAKAKATKSDIEELLKRCRKSINLRQEQHFEFVYGECNVGFLDAVKKLIHLGSESGDNEERFEQLCKLESNDGLCVVTDLLEQHAFSVARRLRLVPLTEHALQDLITVHLQFLSPPAQHKHLADALYARFVRAMQNRTPYFIPSLIQELRDSGLEFTDGGSLLPRDIDPALHEAIVVMQHSERAVPLEVLKDLTGNNQLVQQFESLQVAAVNDAGLWSVNPLLPRLDHSEMPELIGNALRHTLAFVKSNKSNILGLGQVPNAVAFVRKCAALNPAVATIAFDPLDKLLKRSGRKRLVLEVAELTISAARSVAPPTEVARKAEAKALICGQAWVYQRIGDFEKAEQSANDSFRLGNALGWSRNTAFCLKCLGRLRRVRAEQAPHARTRQKFLGQSKIKLLEAINAFSNCPDHGPEHPEVGDCHSLLARTLLLMKRPIESAKHALNAREFITADPGYDTCKDYMDLLILEGELLSDQLDFLPADQKFAEALECLEPENAEKSEIAARAHMARGENRYKWNRDRAAACREFEHAARIWQTLGEYFYHGAAKWRVIELNNEMPRSAKRQLLKVSEPVRVEAVRLYREILKPKTNTTLSQRADITDTGWKKLIKLACTNDAIRNRRW